MKYTTQISGICKIAALLTVLMMAAGCTTMGGKKAAGLKGSTTQTMCYGLSIAQPQGWTSPVVVTDETYPRNVIQEGLTAGGRLQVLDMQRLNAEGVITARVFGYLVNNKRDFVPEPVAAKATPEEFAALTASIIQTDKELAAKEKRESSIIEWSVSRTTVDGNMAILQAGSGRRSDGGIMKVLNLEVYLPQDAGLVVKIMGNAEEAGTSELLDAIMNSIRIRKP